jgi:hypothetical protein
MRNEQLFDHFHEYHMKILLGYFNANPDGKTHNKIGCVSLDTK